LVVGNQKALIYESRQIALDEAKQKLDVSIDKLFDGACSNGLVFFAHDDAS